LIERSVLTFMRSSFNGRQQHSTHTHTSQCDSGRPLCMLLFTRIAVINAKVAKHLSLSDCTLAYRIEETQTCLPFASCLAKRWRGKARVFRAPLKPERLVARSQNFHSRVGFIESYNSCHSPTFCISFRLGVNQSGSYLPTQRYPIPTIMQTFPLVIADPLYSIRHSSPRTPPSILGS
jgi:hypothetical protein